MQTGPIGVEQLLGWLPMPTPPATLDAVTRHTESLTVRWWADGGPELLDELVGTWVALLDDPVFRAAPLDYRLICHDRAALTFCWHALINRAGAEADLARAWEHLSIVASHDPPWADDLLYHRAVYHFNAATIRGDVGESLQAVQLLRELLARLPRSDSRLRPRCTDVLARSLVHHHGNVDQPDEVLEEVVTSLTEALEGLALDSPYRGLVAVSLAKALGRRFQATGRLADVDAGIAALETNPIVEAYAYANAVRATELGILYGSRYRLLHDVDDLRRSTESHERAVSLAQPGSISYTDALTQQGNALLWAYEQTGDVSLAERALRVQEEAVASTHAGQPLYPGRLSGLGNVLMAVFHLTGHRPHLDRAVELYERAIALSPADDVGMPGNHYNAGNTRAVRHRLTGRRRDRVAAVRHYRQACSLGVDLDPEWALGAARQWARLADGRGAWRESTEAYRFAIDAMERLFSWQTSRTHKEAWLRTADGLPAAAGYAFFRAGRPVDAVLIQERGRALLLAEALRGEGAMIGTAGDRRLDIADVYAAAGTRPLVYLDPAEAGGVALVVDPRARRVRAVPLPGLRDAAVRRQVGMLHRAHHGRNQDPGTWLGTVDAVTRWAHQAVLGPLIAALPGVTGVTLVPVGRLSMLPLHAAWEPEREGAGRRFVLDRFRVSYTATARALATARDGLDTELGSALVVDDPAPVHAPPLPFSQVEVAAVGLVTDSVRVLAGRSATREAVLSELGRGGHHLVHMSCHGRGRPESPLDSGLLMADDEMLRLGDLHDLRRIAGVRPRLVVLSACETDQPGTELPDEVISLPSALVQAGCRGVVATQWAVSSLAAALLTARFYQLWRPGTDPGAALVAAQRWLRELTNAELAAAARPANGGSALGLPASASRALWIEARRRPPAERRFAHPATWGAFAHVGV